MSKFSLANGSLEVNMMMIKKIKPRDGRVDPYVTQYAQSLIVLSDSSYCLAIIILHTNYLATSEEIKHIHENSPAHMRLGLRVRVSALGKVFLIGDIQVSIIHPTSSKLALLLLSLFYILFFKKS